MTKPAEECDQGSQQKRQRPTGPQTALTRVSAGAPSSEGETSFKRSRRVLEKVA
jgi:hypothetical protein